MIGYAKSVKDNVQPCTREKLHSAFDSPRVAEVCQAIAEALQKHRQGGMTKDEYEAVKSLMKKQLPILTLHAIFKNGRRKNEEAIPSGLSMYDLDDILNPRVKWAEIEPRKEELGIVLAHVTPSGEGLRLAFRMPQGMSLAEAQAWMASQLGDAQYDSCVKDYARCSFLVPRAYVLYLDESGLFSSPQIITEPLNSPSDDSSKACHPERSEGSVCINANISTSAPQILRDAQNDKNGEVVQKEYPPPTKKSPTRSSWKFSKSRWAEHPSMEAVTTSFSVWHVTSVMYATMTRCG